MNSFMQKKKKKKKSLINNYANHITAKKLSPKQFGILVILIVEDDSYTCIFR